LWLFELLWDFIVMLEVFSPHAEMSSVCVSLLSWFLAEDTSYVFMCVQ